MSKRLHSETDDTPGPRDAEKGRKHNKNDNVPTTTASLGVHGGVDSEKDGKDARVIGQGMGGGGGGGAPPTASPFKGPGLVWKGPGIDTVYEVFELGGGCSVVTFSDPSMDKILPLLIEYLQTKDLLEFGTIGKIFNNEYATPRGEGFFSDEQPYYKFSNRKVVSKPLVASMKQVLDHVNAYVPEHPFTGVLANAYPKDSDCIGQHSDKDVQGHEEFGVVAISLGLARKMQFRPIDTKNGQLQKLDIETKHGQVLVMRGVGFQKLFKHGIPKMTKAQSKAPGANKTHQYGASAIQGRISLTFRRHL